MYTVYKHTNKTNGKVYVGITKQIPKRRWMNGLGYQTQEVFYNAIKKYGWDGFKHEIICNNIETVSEANQLEQYWIKHYHSYIRDPKCNGYNMTLGGDTNQTEKLWTEKEENILKKYYPIEGGKVVLRLKNRTISSIFSRANIIGVHYISDEWSDDEIKRLRECYPIEGIRCFSKFPGRSKNAIHRKAGLLNLEHSNIVNWTEEEISLVNKFYEKEGLKMLWRLPHKSRTQLISFTQKNNIKFDNNAWTNEEIELLRYYYPKIGLDVKNVIERTEMSILQKASELSIKAETSCKVLNVDTSEQFDNVEEASKTYLIDKKLIKSCCCGKTRYAGGYKWRYVGESKRKISWTVEEDQILKTYYPKEGTLCFTRLPNKTKTACKNRVILLSVSAIRNVYCAETDTVYDCLKTAERETGIKKSNIAAACNNTSKTASGYHWCYFDDKTRLLSLSQFKGKKRNIFKKSVRNIDTGIIYSSSSEAEKVLNITSVSECCKGHRKKAGGFRWEYVDGNTED